MKRTAINAREAKMTDLSYRVQVWDVRAQHWFNTSWVETDYGVAERRLFVMETMTHEAYRIVEVEG